ncbi:DNA cytosine methyltransferase [Phaeodactylibacter xiamenensis]|uniref:DNA cytosine methyltransferase n=1 Tax=Phaeodactylibacter xiamenensis TaxID=1524460 RepID=UPI0024A9E133|nr:DNA cytosine methyltransferase [Phaeodactylibacter xiamenensis]
MGIPVIDLFAGPGGLGEGFSSYPSGNHRKFEIKLSVEKDPNAHQTLELRSFYRSFAEKNIPEEYYDVARAKSIKKREAEREKLFNSFPKQAEKARREAWCAELGVIPDEEVDQRIEQGLNDEKNWVLIGGPPCQAYSVAGRSRRQWKDNLDKEDKRVHLYKEYLRIIAKFHPAVFVMENVRGLLSSRVDGNKVFDLIKSDLGDPSSVFPEYDAPKYKIFSFVNQPVYFDQTGQPVYEKDTDYLIKAENYGIPQKRHRVILLGVREDVKYGGEKLLDEVAHQVSVKEAIGDLPKVRSALNRYFVGMEEKNGKSRRVYKSVKDCSGTWNTYLSRFEQEIQSLDSSFKKVNFFKNNLPVGGEYFESLAPSLNTALDEWYVDNRLKGFPNHESRSHLVEDLKRYLFAAKFANKYGYSPKLGDYQRYSEALLPDHANAKSGKFSDRFRVQLADSPATTVTSHISKDGHYFIHYDPSQCRSFTVREAARIQTFPDNYIFCGSRTAQYHQVGNAVPPFLAKKLAEVVSHILDKNQVVKVSAGPEISTVADEYLV